MTKPFEDTELHRCCLCGHEWRSLDAVTEKHIRKAIQVNGAGPYCNLCHHLEMARRIVAARKFNFKKFILQWLPAARRHEQSLSPLSPEQVKIRVHPCPSVAKTL